VKNKNLELQKIPWQHRYSHGGVLRKKRAGRGARPLSTKETVHLVLKADKRVLKSGFRTFKRFALIQRLKERYTRKFFIKTVSFSIQGDHIHLLIKTTRRANYQNFFRVFAGQIAQQLEKEGLLQALVTDTPRRRRGRSHWVLQQGQDQERKAKVSLWKCRVFTRVVKGYRGFLTVINYIKLNELEAQGKIPYQKNRLRKIAPEYLRCINDS
jgi:putative transposase